MAELVIFILFYLLMIPVSSWIIGKLNPHLGVPSHRSSYSKGRDYSVVVLAVMAWPVTLLIIGPFFIVAERKQDA